MSGTPICDRRTALLGLSSSLGLPLLAGNPSAAARTMQGSGGSGLNWDSIKQAFPFAPGDVALNAANLCPASQPVRDVQYRIMQAIDRNPSFENRLQFEALREASRTRLAQLLGASGEEIAITRNTSESNATVIRGLGLKPGDQVVIWDQNHESNRLAWQVAAERDGFEVKTVSTPGEPVDVDQLLTPFRAAVGPSTRVIAFSHIANMLGVRLPARELCAFARERGVWTLVDGAQSLGVLQLDLHAMGCDFFTASTHKWLAGPRECGVLYVRASAIGRLWPSTVSHGWSDERQRSARKFDCLGQQDDARIAAIAAAVEFHDAAGGARVEARILSLNTHLKQALLQRVPGIKILTPMSEGLSGGICVFTVPSADAQGLGRSLYKKHRVSAAVIPFEGRTLVRFCPHIYNLTGEVEHAADSVARSL